MSPYIGWFHSHELQTIAVPVLSAGIYGYPKTEAARILYEVANRGENQAINTLVVVFESSWLPIFERLQIGNEND